MLVTDPEKLEAIRACELDITKKACPEDFGTRSQCVCQLSLFLGNVLFVIETNIRLTEGTAEKILFVFAVIQTIFEEFRTR